jgi:glycerophosphoryl diester phosphodiesterase
MKCCCLHIYLLLLFFLISCSAGRHCGEFLPPTVIAHRGGVSFAPENSLAAIAEAMSLGVDAVEVDVRLSSDGYVVVMHDERIDRTTDGEGRVCDMPYAVIASFSLRGTDGSVTSEKVPLLEDVLGFVGGRCGVLVDVKSSSPGIEKAVTDVIVRCGAEGWVAVQSFSDSVLERFCALGVSFPLEKLMVFKFPLLPFVFDGGISYFSIDKYYYVSSFNIHKRFVRRGFLEMIRREGKEVKLWTFGKDGCAGSIDLPVDGVIVDFPHFW